MNPHSVRVRLVLGAALWIALALALAGGAILVLFSASVERNLTATLDAGVKRLVSAIEPERLLADFQSPMADPRLDTPFSGYYWQVENVTRSEIARSPSLSDVVLEPPAEMSVNGATTLAGPEGQKLSALVRNVEFESGPQRIAYRVTVAEDRAVLDRSVARFGSDMALALTLVGVLLVIAAWVQVHLGLLPFRQVHADIERVRRGEAERLSESHPVEVLPLVREVNQLLASRETAIEAARARAADLAHGLRTPLSVLSATADRLQDRGESDTARLLGDLSTEMTDRIEYQLRIAQLRLRTDEHVLSASLNTALLRTVSVLRKTHRGEQLFWNVAFETDVNVNVDRHDLLELVGILLENASKWAETTVDVAGEVIDGFAVVTVADDGPGLTEDQIGELGSRGRRLDESRPGTGLGLSIAMQILQLNGGTIEFTRSHQQGGLQVKLRLPTAQAHPAASG